MFRIWIKRHSVLKHVRFEADDSLLLFDKGVRFCLGEDSQIIVKKGTLRIGYPLPGSFPRPAYDKTVIVLEPGATLEVHDDVFIAGGAYLHVSRKAKIVFMGHNWFAHNGTLMCRRSISIGRHSSFSWNVTLIDDDGRTFYDSDGNAIQSDRRPLVIEDHVGVQMNVTIPKGVHIGKGAIIGTGTVVRRDVPENSLVYQNPELKIRHDTTPGLQRLVEDAT